MTNEQTPSITKLLAHHQFVEQLALRLTGERGSADDLVQDTWLEAIERPPRHGANLSAWLQVVVRHNHYRRKHRDALLKTTELDPVLPTDDGSAEEFAERSEISRQIAALTLRLEEPYRSVVILRFYEDKTPTQIASQLGRPVNTVTSQLARGLQQLRTELDRQHEGDRSRWISALLPLAPRGRGRGANAPLRTPSGASRRSFRRLALGAGALLATCLVAVMSYVAFSEPLSSREAPETLAVAPPRELPATEPTATKEGRDPIAVAREPTSPSPAPSSVPPSEGPGLDLEVVDTSGAPIAGARIDMTRASAVQEGEDLATQDGIGKNTIWTEVARTDELGRARVDPSADNAVSLQTLEGSFLGLIVRSPGFVRSPAYYLEYPPEPRAPIRVSLEAPALMVRGQVIDDKGTPVRALVFMDEEGHWVDKDGMGLAQRAMGILTDQQGRFVYDGLPPGQHRVAIRGDGFLPLLGMVEGSGTLERTFVVERGATLIGWVVTKVDGQPVAGARISAEYMPRRLRPVTQGATTDAEGTFEVTGIGRGLVRVFAQHPSDASLSASAFLRYSGSEQQEWQPELDHNPPLRLRVVTDDEQPVARAGVQIYNEVGGEDWHRSFSADDEGVVSITGLPVANYLATVFRTERDISTGYPSCAGACRVTVGDRENVLVIPRVCLESATVKGRIVAAPERRRTRLVYLRPLDADVSGVTTVDPETGIFLKESISPQRYQATLFVERLGAVPMGVISPQPNETLDLGEFLVPVGASVDVDWRWTGEDAEYSYRLTQFTPNEGGGPHGNRWEVCFGQGRVSEPLQVLPGQFEWAVLRKGNVVDFQELEVQPGSVFHLTTGPEETAR